MTVSGDLDDVLEQARRNDITITLIVLSFIHYERLCSEMGYDPDMHRGIPLARQWKLSNPLLCSADAAREFLDGPENYPGHT